MKRVGVVLLTACIAVPVSVSFAKASDRIITIGAQAIVYQSPKNGDLYVPVKTTIVLRLAEYISAGNAASNCSFIVRGDHSGLHTGTIAISDDDRTVIFKPLVPFDLNEEVHVQFSSGGEGTAPVLYSFHTSSMSEAERNNILMEIRQKEYEASLLSAVEETSPHDPSPQFHFPNFDSLPCFFHVDTMTTPSPGNIFFSAVNLFSGSFSFIGMLDNAGAPSFHRDIPRGCENFKVLPDNTFSYFAQSPAPKSGLDEGMIYRIDTKGNILNTYQTGNGYVTDYHDFQLLPNGHALLVSFDPEYVDMTKMVSDTAAKPQAKVTGAIIQEIDKDQNVVFQWRSWDHVNITDATHEVFTSSFVDYVHINTAFYDTDGNIIASFRHMDEVLKISRTDGAIIWRMGGKHNQFTFLDDTLKFSHQHHPTRLENGHLTLWDNGNYRLIDTTIKGRDTIVNRPFSRAVEFDLDEVHHTARAVWEFRDVPLSPAGGNVQRLANGNTFLNFGIQTSPNMMEITPEGEKVFQLSLDHSAWCYRAYKFPQTITASVSGEAKTSFGITGIYPNPVESVTTIAYTGSGGTIEINLTDITGHTVRSLKHSSQAGENSFGLSLHDLPNGAYYCRISQNDKMAVKMLVVQK